METIKLPFGNIVISESIPKDTIYLVPPVQHVRYENVATGEVKEYLEFNAKQGAVIVNIGGDE